MLNYFIKEFNPSYIISYADKCHSNGNLYRKIGFKKESHTPINYYWCKHGLRKNRFSFRKDILIKQGFNPNKTEVEIMRERGYYKVYNCGNFKFEMFLDG